MPGSSPGSLLRGLHHRFLHTVFACPIQADLVAIGIVEIGMPPTPGHHAWQLSDVKPFLLEIAAEVFEFTEKLSDPGPVGVPEKRDWTLPQVYRTMRGWLFPYIRSRVLPGDFHPITAYLFVEYKCNLDCWYCWAYDNKVRGMTEDVARRSIDWLYDHGCRVLALMGGEPLLRPDFAHKVVYYAAKKGFWIYVGTNGRLLRPDVADRLGDAGVGIFNFALDAWDEKPSLPKPWSLHASTSNI